MKLILGTQEARWLMIAAETFEEDDTWPENNSNRRAFRNAITKLRNAYYAAIKETA